MNHGPVTGVDFLCIDGDVLRTKKMIEKCTKYKATAGRNSEVKCVETKKELREIRREIGLISQHFNLVKRSTVQKNVLSGRLGYYGTLKSIFGLFTKEDYENAYNIANKIISTYNSHKEDYYEFIYNLYNKYRNKELENIKSK